MRNKLFIQFARYIKYIYYIFAGIEVVHCIGDSHVGAFDYYREDSIFNKTRFRVFSIGGATAMGIGNPNSQTDARRKFLRYLSNLPRKHSILVCLGEVDCGFVIWYRKKKYDTSVGKQLDTALDRYKKFIKYIKSMGFNKIIILSAPLPTIDKRLATGIVGNLRKEVKVSLKNKTKLTIQFNKNIKAFSEKIGAGYIDMSEETLCKKTGNVKKTFVDVVNLDHHLKRGMVIPIYTKKLKRLGFK